MAGQSVFRIKSLRNHILQFASKNASDLTKDFTDCRPPFCYVNKQTGEKRNYKKECIENAHKWIAPLLINYPSQVLIQMEQDSGSMSSRLVDLNFPGKVNKEKVEYKFRIVEWDRFRVQISCTFDFAGNCGALFSCPLEAAKEAGICLQNAYKTCREIQLVIYPGFSIMHMLDISGVTQRIGGFPENPTWQRHLPFMGEHSLQFTL